MDRFYAHSGRGITVEKGLTIVNSVYTLKLFGPGVVVAAGPAGVADITVGGGGGAFQAVLQEVFSSTTAR